MGTKGSLFQLFSVVSVYASTHYQTRLISQFYFFLFSGEFFGNCRKDSPKFDDCLLFALNKARPCLQYGTLLQVCVLSITQVSKFYGCHGFLLTIFLTILNFLQNLILKTRKILIPYFPDCKIQVVYQIVKSRIFPHNLL